jgi:hypothetical protein
MMVVEADPREADPPDWLAAAGLSAGSDIVEQQGFAFVLERRKRVVIVDRKDPKRPRIVGRKDVPGASRMVGFTGGLALLATYGKDAWSQDFLLLYLFDPAGAQGGAPSLKEIDRSVVRGGADLLAAEGRVGRGWRDVVVYIAAVGTSDGEVRARRRLWATETGGWADGMLRQAGRPRLSGVQESTADFFITQSQCKHRRESFADCFMEAPLLSHPLAMTASNGLLYILDALQGLIVLDTVTEPYWARVMVPATRDVPRPRRHPSAAGLELDLRLGDGRDPAADQGFVWLGGQPEDLAPLGRQVWTQPLLLQSRGSGEPAFSGDLKFQDWGPTVRRANGAESVPVRVDLREAAERP